MNDWLTRHHSAAHVGLSVRHWDRKVRRGEAPQPTRRAGERSPRWSRGQLDAWMSGGARRDGGPGSGSTPTPWQ
jgi:predicted DNA-binding transcriptional regulator AlpA